jgi:hypothetical protein
MPALTQSSQLSDSPPSPGPEPEIEAQTRKRPKKQLPAKPKAKLLSSKHSTAHNIIEKRYRNNLNNKIATLRNSLPSFRIAAQEKHGDRDGAEDDLDEQNETPKLNKVSAARAFENFAIQHFLSMELHILNSVLHLLVIYSCSTPAIFLFKDPSALFLDTS